MFAAALFAASEGAGPGGNRGTVFGIFEREGCVCIEIVQKRTLQAVVRGRVDPEAIVHSDDGLVDMGYRKHFCIRHREDRFADGRAHVNGIESSEELR